ncbi:hypothetical protein, partial [Prevotellamassilia timonensis]|uniref:hypothetical protein n=1 Tax=Prevotellamassilia timonensis TaxID=1852370 RepID=UPI00307B0305
HTMLTKSVKSVISVVLKHVAQAKKSVQSVRSVSDSNILPSGKTPKHQKCHGQRGRCHIS